MKKLNVMSYRFSISWPRIFPDGYGKVNEKGAAFYDSLIDELIKNGIEPSITLYHWDLPLKFHEEGGWLKRESADIFADYAKYCFKRYGGRVKMWATFNEMYVAAHLGYESGKFAPGIQDPKKAMQAAHHMHLAHAKAVKAFRQSGIKGQIGIVHCMSPVYDMDKTNRSAENARKVDGIWNRWFTDPSFKGSYPEDIMEMRKRQGTAPEILPGDMELIKENRADFFGKLLWQEVENRFFAKILVGMIKKLLDCWFYRTRTERAKKNMAAMAPFDIENKSFANPAYAGRTIVKPAGEVINRVFCRFDALSDEGFLDRCDVF